VPTNPSALTLAFVLAAGCGWGPADPALHDELAELRSELTQVRAELAELRGDADLQAEAIVDALPDPSAPPLGPAERTAIRRRTRALADDVDADLGDVQDQLDGHADELEQLHLEVQAISDVVNAHATELDRHADALSDLETQTVGLRTLEGVMSFEDGRVVIQGADVLLKPEPNSDGSPGRMGQILNRTP
jgi:hypothetical protein